jgi:CRISPR/Cas system CSM-associated protein Csm3 (group 7 of RAMP superfamily)
VIVQGFVYATLGHNIEGPVIGHPFFGTNKVISDLKQFNTFPEGFVELKKENYIRRDGLVVEISG